MAKRWNKKRADADDASPDLRPGSFSMAGPALARLSWLPRAFLIIAAGLWIYWPALHGGWIWDDDRYITHNRLMHDPAGFWKVWINPDGQGNYYPLTSFVQWIQWNLWGNDTLGYHLTNVGLHLVSAFLVWRLLARIGLPLAWLGGLLFTAHPIMVESVAWITELKNTLSLPPLLLAMLAWLAWKREGDRRFYFWSLALFLVSMLAKTSGMMLPVILLGDAWWRREKIGWSHLKTLAPFFAIALAAGLVTLFPPHAPGAPVEMRPAWALGPALAGVGWSVLFLLGKSLLPIGLMPAYPGFVVTSPTAFDLVPWPVLGGFFLLLWLNRAGWGRHVLFGFGFFIVNLIPVLGYILMNSAIMVWSMDHLVYLPVIGLIGLAVAGLGRLDARLSALRRAGGRALVAAMVLLMAWEGHAYAGWFAGPDVFWNNLLRRDPGSWLAQLNLGCLFIDRHDYPEAVARLRKVVRLRPDLDDGLYNLGVALDKEGRTAEAQELYRRTLKVNPNDAKAYLNLGEIMKRSGNLAEAEALFRQGLKIAPDDASLCTDLGDMLLQTGRIAEAIGFYEHAVELDPDLAQLQYNLGVALLQTGSLSEAEDHLVAAVTLDPKIVAAHENLGVILAQSGRLSEAISEFQAAIRLDDKYVIARDNLARALVQTGQIPEAIEQFKKVLEIDPQDANARENLPRLQQFEMERNAASRH